MCEMLCAKPIYRDKLFCPTCFYSVADLYRKVRTCTSSIKKALALF